MSADSWVQRDPAMNCVMSTTFIPSRICIRIPHTKLLFSSTSRNLFSGRDKVAIDNNIEHGRSLYNNFSWQNRSEQIWEPIFSGGCRWFCSVGGLQPYNWCILPKRDRQAQEGPQNRVLCIAQPSPRGAVHRW